MKAPRRVALLQSHQRIPPTHVYYLSDLVELCGLAAAIRDLVDDVFLPVSPSDRDPLGTFDRFMRRHRPELVGISSFTCGARSAREYARIAHDRGAFVVVGGFHPSALPEEVLGWPEVDAVVRGEGEHALADLVRTGSPEGVPGMSYRDDGGFVHHPVPPVIEDLDALPMPLRELRPERFGLAGLDYHTDTIYSSRGCRGRCRFCANHLVGRSWRGRSNESILEELLTIPPPRKGKRKTIKFWDSSFLTDPERVERLCTSMIEQELARHFRFIAECRVEDVIRAADILGTMRSAGIERIGCGVESPSRVTHRQLGKGINLNHVQKAAELLTTANIQFTKFLILGHPGETTDDILAYPDYALSHGVNRQRTTFFVMTPYPATELADEYDARGWITSKDWDLYTNFGAVVQPDGISAEQLQILHGAVAASYGARRRFLEHRSSWGVFERLLEPILLYSKVSLVKGMPRHEVADGLMEVLRRAAGSWERDRRSKRTPRRRDRVALRFHHPDHDPVVVGVLHGETRDTLVIREGAEALEDPRGRLWELHVSVPRLVRLVERIDHRRLGHDAMTLTHAPGGFKPAWVPTFARDLLATLAGVAGLAGAHAWTAVARSGRRQAAPPDPT